MRKVKDAKDLSNNELIYFKSHAKATYMSDGTTVEDAINNIEVGTGADLSDYATKEELNSKQNTITDLETIRQGAAKGATALQEHQSLEGYTKDIDLANVAKSGSYNDLKNKPTIPSAVTESTVSGWGFTKNTGTYTKPSTGIPKSDLASAVQTSLGKADTALQSYTEQYKGTVTGVKINGTTKNPSNGVVDLGTVITSHQDISNKQDKLVSGTNIKTINGTSILGSGDITISGGSSSGGSGAYAEVNHETSDTTLTLTPNTFHVWDEVASLTLDFGSETAGVANEYLFQFTSGATAMSLTLPDDIKWANDTPTIEPNKIYQVSILKGLASVLEFDNTPAITLINFTVDNTSFNAESGMLWSEWVASSYNTSGYISIAQNKVTHLYTQGNLFTTSGVTVNSSDVVQPIKYTFTNPWA